MIINAFNKFDITTHLRKLLINSDITNLVNNNIFPLIAPEGTEGDIILYYRDSYKKEYATKTIVNDTCNVFFAIVSDNYDKSIQIAKKLNEIVEGEHITDDNNYKYYCRLADSTEDYEDQKYLQILLFEIN